MGCFCQRFRCGFGFPDFSIRAAADYYGVEAPDMSEPADSGSSWLDFFNFSWLRDLFQNIIRNLFKGWTPNLTF